MCRKPEDLSARFWRKVDASAGPDACWPWLGFKDRDGYGKFDLISPIKRAVPASRLAYELTYGPIPDGMLACHTCDNPSCCNPKHIYAGTRSDNNRDPFLRNRCSHKGEADPASKLTEEKIRIIRIVYDSGVMNQKQLAEIFGVHHSTISCITTRKSWSHI